LILCCLYKINFFTGTLYLSINPALLSVSMLRNLLLFSLFLLFSHVKGQESPVHTIKVRKPAKTIADTTANLNVTAGTGITYSIDWIDVPPLENLRYTDPGFPGGVDSLFAFMKKNTVSAAPQKLNNSLFDTVKVKFHIDKAGKITDIAIDKTVNPACDSAAVRMVRKMPAWKPATINGKPKDIVFHLPVSIQPDGK
jgi:TonB family protein